MKIIIVSKIGIDAIKIRSWKQLSAKGNVTVNAYIRKRGRGEG